MPLLVLALIAVVLIQAACLLGMWLSRRKDGGHAHRVASESIARGAEASALKAVLTWVQRDADVLDARVRAVKALAEAAQVALQEGSCGEG